MQTSAKNQKKTKLFLKKIYRNNNYLAQFRRVQKKNKYTSFEVPLGPSLFVIHLKIWLKTDSNREYFDFGSSKITKSLNCWILEKERKKNLLSKKFLSS